MINNGVHRTRERKRTEFPNLVPQYFLNSKGVLEESPILKNTQEMINSAEYTRLDDIYDRMLEIHRSQNPQYNEGELEVFEREKAEDDLDRLMELDRIRAEYAQSAPEVADMSHSEMVAHVNSKIKAHNEKIKKIKEGEPEDEKTPPEPKSE